MFSLLPIWNIFASQIGPSLLNQIAGNHRPFWYHVLFCIHRIQKYLGFEKNQRKKSLRKQQVHPRKLTWKLKMMVWKTMFLFQGCILTFHVNLPGCNFRFRGLFFSHDLATRTPKTIRRHRRWMKTLGLFSWYEFGHFWSGFHMTASIGKDFAKLSAIAL